MIISHKYKFIFLKTYKTAGTSLEVFLSSVCDLNDILTPIYPSEPKHIARNYEGYWNILPELLECENKVEREATLINFKTKQRFYNHIPAWRLKHRVGRKVWDNYFKFTIERNFTDRIISYFFMLKMRSNDKLTPADFVSKKLFLQMNNKEIYTNSNGSLAVDKIVNYEKLNIELKELFSNFHIPFESLNIYAKSGITDRTRKLEDIFTKEQILEIMNYENKI